MAAGEVVGDNNILSAACMNNVIDLANYLIESGVVVDGVYTPLLPLSTPSLCQMFPLSLKMRF